MRKGKKNKIVGAVLLSASVIGGSATTLPAIPQAEAASVQVAQYAGDFPPLGHGNKIGDSHNDNHNDSHNDSNDQNGAGY